MSVPPNPLFLVPPGAWFMIKALNLNVSLVGAPDMRN